MISHNRITILYIFVLLMISGSLYQPSSVFAHAIMVKSQPEKDSTITDYQKQVDIWFNEKVAEQFKALAVINSSGKRVDNKDIRQEVLDLSHIYITTPQLPPDTYTVRYRVMSADTHIVTGKFNFTITQPD